MSDFTWPASIVPSASEWRLIANTASFVSPLSGTTRTLARGGDRWACTLTINALVDDDRAVLNAFLARLRGQAHRVVLPDHAYRRRGALTSNILVKGASQTGTSLACDGATSGVTNALRAGDMITVESYLYMVVADTNSDGSGNVTLTLNMPLRQSPADNASVNLTAPTARFMLADNTVGWSNRPRKYPSIVSGYSLDFIEDIVA